MFPELMTAATKASVALATHSPGAGVPITGEITVDEIRSVPNKFKTCFDMFRYLV